MIKQARERTTSNIKENDIKYQFNIAPPAKRTKNEYLTLHNYSFKVFIPSETSRRNNLQIHNAFGDIIKIKLRNHHIRRAIEVIGGYSTGNGGKSSESSARSGFGVASESDRCSLSQSSEKRCHFQQQIGISIGDWRFWDQSQWGFWSLEFPTN